MVLHAFEDGDATILREDASVLYFEVRARVERLDLLFQELLDRELKGLERFAQADKVELVCDVFF